MFIILIKVDLCPSKSCCSCMYIMYYGLNTCKLNMFNFYQRTRNYIFEIADVIVSIFGFMTSLNTILEIESIFR